MKAFKIYFINFWSKRNTHTSESWKSILISIFPLVILHFILEKGLSKISVLPVDSYYNYSIFYELIKKCIYNWYAIIILALFIIYRKRLFITWKSFEKGRYLRLFIVVISCILTWYYATYNFYFNQNHYIDRLLLIVFLVAIYWRPIFLVPYILLLLSILWQFESFPGYAIGASPFLLTRIIILFLACFIFKVTFNKFRFSTFIFLLGCIVSTHYFTSGFGKLNSQWILGDSINYLLPATYNNGWLSFLDKSTISTLTQFLGWFNTPLRVFTLLVECGIIFFFFHVKWSRFIIKSAILMHIGIFAYSGIFFWMWILVLVSLLFLYKKNRLDIKSIFNKKYFIISILLIISGEFWTSAVGLHWHDSPLSYSYRVYGLTQDGEKHQLPANFFSSYDYQFVTTNFKYLNPEPRLNIIWGATGAKVSHYFNLERSVEDAFKFEKEYGNIYENIESQKIFKQFINQYVSNWNTHLDDKDYLKHIKAPPLYWTFPYRTFSKEKKKISAVMVNEITSYYTDKNGYREIRNKEILNLKVDF